MQGNLGCYGSKHSEIQPPDIMKKFVQKVNLSQAIAWSSAQDIFRVHSVDNTGRFHYQ